MRVIGFVLYLVSPEQLFVMSDSLTQSFVRSYLNGVIDEECNVFEWTLKLGKTRTSATRIGDFPLRKLRSSLSGGKSSSARMLAT